MVPGEARVMHEPAECPLADPAPRNHLDALHMHLTADGVRLVTLRMTALIAIAVINEWL